MFRQLLHRLRPALHADFVAVELSDTFQTLSQRLEAMKHYRNLSRKQFVLAACALGLLGTLGVVPWRVVAQEAKPVAQRETQPLPPEKKLENKQTPQQLIVGTWRGGPSGSDELLIEKSGDYVWLSGVQAFGSGPIGPGGMGMMPMARGMGRGMMLANPLDGGRVVPRGPMMGRGMMGEFGGRFPGGGMRSPMMGRGFEGEMGMGGSSIGGVPFTQQSGHWKLRDDGTLLLTFDAAVPSLRGLPPSPAPVDPAAQLAPGAEGEPTAPKETPTAEYRIVRLDASLLRLNMGLQLNIDGSPAEGSTLFFRRVDDQEKRELAAADLPPDVQRLADLAHFNAEETKAFGVAFTHEDASVELLNLIVAARQRKIDFAQLFKLTPDEATAYLEVLKLAGGRYSAVGNLAEQGQLSPTESAAVEKLKKFKTDFASIASTVNESLTKLTQERDPFSQPATPENQHPPVVPKTLTSIRMLEKFQALLMEFDAWLNQMVFNS